MASSTTGGHHSTMDAFGALIVAIGALVVLDLAAPLLGGEDDGEASRRRQRR